MAFWNRNKPVEDETYKSVPDDMLPMSSPGAVMPMPPRSSSYIEIVQSKKGNTHVRIRGGNHKIRFNGENMYSIRNARRAAKLLSSETGFRVVDRTRQ